MRSHSSLGTLLGRPASDRVRLAVRISFVNLDRPACCECQQDPDWGRVNETTVLPVLPGQDSCPLGFVPGECGEILDPDGNVIEEPCKVEHSRFSNFLTFFNDYVIFLDLLIHFFVGYKRLDAVTRTEVMVWDRSMIFQHYTVTRCGRPQTRQLEAALTRHPWPGAATFGCSSSGPCRSIRSAQCPSVFCAPRVMCFAQYYRLGGHYATADYWRLLRFVRLPRVGELHRAVTSAILQLVIVFPALTSYVHLVQLCLGIGIIGHVLACCLYFVGNPNQDEVGCADDGGCGWVQTKGLQSEDISVKYTAAMYYAFTQITTVGFGDISASTVKERWFSVVSQLIGGFVFGYVLGNIQQILAADNIGQQEYNTLHEKVIEYMRQESCPMELRTKILGFLNSKYPTHTLFSEAEIMIELTPSLRSELLQHKYSEYIHHVPFLSNINFTENITTALCTAVQLNYYYAGDTICRQGNQANHLYIVNTGAVAELHQHIDGPDASPRAAEDAENNKPKLLNVLGPGDYWGEVAILVQYRHYHSHCAKTFCTVCALPREKVLVRRYILILTQSRELTCVYVRRSRRSVRTTLSLGTPWPTCCGSSLNG